MSQAALFVLSPALVFSAVSAAKLGTGDVVTILLFAALIAVVLFVMSRGIGRLGHLSRPQQAALDLTSIFPNTNNLGLPVVSLALGGTALGVAALFVLSQVFLVNSVGAYLAGRGRFAPRETLRRIVHLPAIWAGLLALGLRAAGGQLPTPLLGAVHLGAAAYAPVVLLVLGGAIAELPVMALLSQRIWLSVLVRLAVAPALAFVLIMLLGLGRTLGPALFLESAMPAAVNALILSREFDSNPTQVGQVIALSTLLSLLTLPVAIILARTAFG